MTLPVQSAHSREDSEPLDWENIYAEYRPRIERYLMRLVGPKEAEDLTQEIFIRAGQALGSFRRQSSLATWLYRIASNIAADRMKSRAHRREAQTTELPDTVYDPSPSTEDQIVRQEMNYCIRRYITSLPENYRAILILSDIEGFRNQEIAVILGLSPGTVKIRLHRAKARLKKALAANCIFYYTDCNQLACEPKSPTI